MEIYFTNTFAIPIIATSSLLALLVVFLQYYNAKDGFLNKEQKALLSIVRFFAFFLIGILLSGIALRHIKTTRSKPIAIIAIDNSSSMKAWEAGCRSIENKLENTFNKNDFHIWEFGDSASRTNKLAFNKSASNYGLILDELSQNYLNANIGAVFLLGDGMYNQGSDPVFKSKTFPFPLYTVGFGDTTNRFDVAIKNVSHNKTAFLGNYFPVEVGIDFSEVAGNQVTLEITNIEQSIYKQEISITSDHQFLNDVINLKAEKAGINNYLLSISGIENELNLDNNTFEFSIFVNSEKQRILILGNSPHPDLATLNKALKGNPNYSIELQTGIDPKFSYEDYDLVIAHQIPDRSSGSVKVIENLIQNRIPILFILGEKSSISRFNQSQNNVSVQKNELFENASAMLNDQFEVFKIEPVLKNIMKTFPPLSVPFGEVESNIGIHTIAFQLLKNIETQKPIISVGSNDNLRMGYILGEGIWQWRIYDYLLNNTHTNFDKLIQKITNYLIIKPNEDSFNIYCVNIFDENESVNMQADLYNESNELLNHPEVEITILAEDSTDYTYIFNRDELKYKLNAGKLPVGNYAYSAKTILAGEELLKEGVFRVVATQKELMETKANFKVLNQLSQNTGGKFVAENDIDELIVTIENAGIFKSRKMEQSVFQKLIDLKWLFFFILILLSVEWFLRKFWGTY